nr:hypothetical protein Iba_scaffold5942CG0280 [Ipomoea batatas]
MFLSTLTPLKVLQSSSDFGSPPVRLLSKTNMPDNILLSHKPSGSDPIVHEEFNRRQCWQSTYAYWYSSASMLLIFSGILPIKLASFIPRCLSFFNWVNLGGISCGEKLFWLRTRTSRFRRLPISGGNEPFVNRSAS